MRKIALVPAIIAGCVAAGLAGCASMSKGPNDNDLIQDLLDEWKSATEAKDLDRMMACFSQEFRGEEGGREEMRVFLADFIDKGNLESAKVDLVPARTVIQGNTASVVSIGLSSTAGGIVVDLDLQKDPDGAWRIIRLSGT